jgi:hypothetical protein
LGCCTVTSCFSPNSSPQTVTTAITAHNICARCDEPITWEIAEGYAGLVAEYTCDGFVHPECGEYGK